MNFLQCIQTPCLKQSLPTTPLTLKGKKKPKKLQKQSSSYLQSLQYKQNKNSLGFWNQKKNKYSLSLVSNNLPNPQKQSYLTTISKSVRQFPIKSHHHQTKQQQRGAQIRKILDQNIKKQYKALNQRRYSLNIDKRSHIQPSTFIPKLQKNLVNQYIQLIYKDYFIPDPLACKKYYPNQKPSLIPTTLATPQSIKQQIPIRRRNQHLKNRKSRKAVQLKQNFLIQMCNSQPQTARQHQNQNYPKLFSNSQIKSPQKPSDIHLSSRNTMLHSFPIQQITQQPAQKQIAQVFRYCFLCQQLILQANIQIHQRQKCPQFRNLYKLTFKDLKHKLLQKILRIKRQTQQLYKNIFQLNNQNLILSKLTTLKNQIINYLNHVNNNLTSANSTNVNTNFLSNNNFKILQQNYKNKLKCSFSTLMLSYQQNYFQLYQKLKKLHWFNLMLKNLQIKCQQTLNNSSKQPQQITHRKNIFSPYSSRTPHRPHKSVYLQQ